MTQVSIDHAAALIGVSTATIRNWMKAGHLTAVAVRPTFFLEKDVLSLKGRLSSGEMGKLRTRANKSASSARQIRKPQQAGSNSSEVAHRILTLYEQFDLDISALLFFCALRVLALVGQVPSFDWSSTSAFKNPIGAKRQAVTRSLAGWQRSLQATAWHDAYLQVNSIIKAADEDLLGDIYQVLTVEGDKSNKGAYYTPMDVVYDAIDRIPKSCGSFLDPCCGSGRYLIVAAKLLSLTPTAIYGFDTDDVAVHIAKINLLLAFSESEFEPRVTRLDAITELATGDLVCETNNLRGSFGAIATNPPWGSYKNTAKNSLSDAIRSNEAFSLLIEKSLQLLRSGGNCSFVLPASMLKIQAHQDVRKLILETASIKRVVKLGRPFESVFTEVIRLDLIKQLAPPEWEIEVVDGGHAFAVPQKNFIKSESFAFNIDIRTNDDLLLHKIYSVQHVTLKDNADWALGIVTGNNASFVSDVCHDDMEPVFRGSDIDNFTLRPPSAFLRYEPRLFQQVAKDHLYRAPEKLVYKFISNKLKFAFDDKKRLTLNSANIVIPRIDGISIMVALAYLNSDVFQFIFKKRFSTHKVLKSDLETMPFPILSHEVSERIDVSMKAVLSGDEQFATVQELIFASFNLTSDEICTLKTSLGK